MLIQLLRENIWNYAMQQGICLDVKQIHNKFMEECSEKLSDKIEDLYDQMDRIH
jgi:hypothetical protein